MKKIKTPFGYLCLPNKRMIESTATAYDEIPEHKNIDIINITSDNAKKLYRTENPYGIGYTDHYSHVLISKKAITKLYGGNSTRKIDFLEVS
ncbi:MAG: hypothetical protein E7603_02955 [Ruminococcaceae bacterium]|nr:hypothetical protein [Oscillospiraceae bacterium]